MKSNYKQAVVVFGILLPAVFLIALTFAVYWKAGSIHQEYELKVNLQNQDAMAAKQNAILAKKVKVQDELLSAWKGLLAKEDRRTFLEHWKTVRKKFKANEFVGERPVWSNASMGLGKDVAQPSSSVTLSFDASYRAMQSAFLEVETELPQMQLDSLEMIPNQDGKTIHFKTVYTVWTQK